MALALSPKPAPAARPARRSAPRLPAIRRSRPPTPLRACVVVRSPGDSLAKRAFDFLFAAVLLVPAMPVIAICAVLVVAIDRRKPFYVDSRVGRHGRAFGCVKLRTMSSDPSILPRYFAANPDEEVRYLVTRKLRSDPRISRLGGLLRKSSLDELPQLFNVLVGQMSVVGPRPLSHSEFLARGDRRIALAEARPGLTGLWQVSGRSDTTQRRRCALDHYYVTRWTFGLDMLTLVKTPLAVVASDGAR